MKIAVVCKSDSTGGAAVTSFRLTEALIEAGQEARLLVLEKKTDAPFVVPIGRPKREKTAFLLDRLEIYLKNGLSKKNLFKIDTGDIGLPLWKNPVIKEADAVILNWVNQGMLSLKGVERICGSGKKVIWVMHDMWNFTGICHHSMDCKHYRQKCGNCFLLGKIASGHDLSRRVWKRKSRLYAANRITFVAVSSWLENLARSSSLLKNGNIVRIPNAYPVEKTSEHKDIQRNPRRILFVAARIDDPIKGMSILEEGINEFIKKAPESASLSELLLIGNLKEEKNRINFKIPHKYLGAVSDPRELAEIYRSAGVVISTSLFENLPGTLVEGQANGCIPVAFDRGGQKDIVEHLVSGYLVPWSDDSSTRGNAVADGLIWALEQPEKIRDFLPRNVINHFSYRSIAKEYLNLLK